MSLTDRMAKWGDKVRGALASVKGDKMLLLIVILLYLFSIMTVLSSSSFLANSETGRVSMLLGQLAIIGISGFTLWAIYKYCTLKGLMRLGIIGFFISLGMLVFLTLHIRIPHVMESQNLNNAWRTIYFFGHIQVHVFEVVKVFSILYMAWAVTAWKEEMELMEENLTPQSSLEDPRGFRWIRRLAWNFKADWMNTPFFKRTLIVYLPFIVTCALVSRGSNSSAGIIAFGMLITLMIGGFGIRKLLAFMILGGIALGGYMMISGKSGSDDGRRATGKSRIEAFFSTYEGRLAEIRKQMEEGKATRSDYNRFIDDNRQTQAAKWAIREGRVTPLGKGPGGSTQKYKVIGLFGDFMFSFICEEYGILGAVFVIFLFGALIARGTRIANYCSDTCALTMVAGLVLLISGQAIIHILVNTGAIPMTGQTLPILSDGKSAMLMFSIALGVVLGISRLVREEIDREEAGLDPVITHEGNDEIQQSLDDLDALDTNGLQE
ncbi:MAG: FtsW/RodA/SpoVE family cell cycle protein [Bacteroidales bacterium]|nr:FtsW/RodA/SpoVE family cell cycle protein [Bacteroidales bacterium]